MNVGATRGLGVSPRVAHTSRRFFVGMYATTKERYNIRVSNLRHYYGPNHVHYLTTSIPQGGSVRQLTDLIPSV